MPEAIKVEGLGELRKALKGLQDPSHTREFRDGLKKAADIGAHDARGRASRFSKTAANSIRATAGGNVAYIVGGKARVPWYPWLDFGSRVPRTGQPRSVGPWAHSGRGPRGGRIIFPAIEAKERQMTEAVGDALDDAFKKAGF